MATHSSIRAWEIPWTEKLGGLQSLVSQSRTRLSNSTTARSIPGLTARAGSEGSLSSGLSCSHLRVHTSALAVLINYFLDDATALPISMRLPQCDSHRDGVQIPC